MILFWAIVPLMLVVGLAFILIPLWRKPNQQAVNNLRSVLAQEKLSQLKQDYERGDIAEQEFKRLSADIRATPADVRVGASNIKLNRWLGLLSVAVFIAAVILLYQHWGALPKVEQTAYIMQRTEQVKAQINKMGSPKQIIAQMKVKVEENASDPKGWYLLGRLYFSAGQFQAAINAYQKANQLKANNPDIMTALAEAEFFQNNRELSDHAKELLNAVLKEYPNYLNALNLLAVNAYGHQEYQQAVNYWQRIIPLLSPDSNEEKQLQTLITKAQSQIQTSDQLKPVNLAIKVTIAPKLKSEINASDYLLVYAKEVNGPPMPVAVLKQKVTEFPVTVELNDKTNMLPNLTLAQTKQIEITARISRSGSASAQAGDLYGRSEVIHPQTNHGNIDITIDQIANG